jgi:acetyl-CoA carboxylase alpha subunit
MKLAEKFNIPVVTFIDTPGAFRDWKLKREGRLKLLRVT